MSKNNKALMDYVYDIASNEFTFVFGDRESAEQTVRTALALENPTLVNLGFISEKDNAFCVYEPHEKRYTSIEVHYPQWGDKEYDFRLFTPVNEYGLVVTYYKDE